ncbi:MAG: arylsulfatase, partial [Thermomicrobiales bacterium]|nr:arylsulfatase [Thermomicrobiales bacterium]
LRPPEGAPNVLVILLDDAGFAASSTFGGPIPTPTAERLAEGGLKFNRFHTTGLCSPTRSALLTGRNHHSVNMGGITEIATSAPGNTSVWPKSKAPLAMTLKLNGYSTAQFGKCHEVPVWQTSPMGPFDQWPTGGGGFETFYGFIAGETNQYYPALYDGTAPVEPEKTPDEGYHLTEDLATRASQWLRQQHALMPDKPFFLYFAPGATHAPHHVPREWIDRFQGQFDAGWDALREASFARQKALGVIPEDAELTPRPAEIPAWDDMPSELKPIMRRQMEIYAAFLAHTDHHIGRIIDTLQDLGELDNTLIYYIIGDNGASAEGTLNGCYNEMASLNGLFNIETPEFLLSKLDDFGGPLAYNHYAVGWAWAMDTPYQWTKQVASHWGGTRNGTIVHWPAGIAAQGEIRSQFHHVIDIAPTVLEAAGIPAPAFVNGIQQAPLEGTSMAGAFASAQADDHHTTQYFEIFGNRGIYHQGWTAVTRHSTPWLTGELPALDQDVWELYGPDDWSQARNVAAENPGRLAYLQNLWLIEATKYHVLPIDDRRYERGDAVIAGRPQLIQCVSQRLYGGMGRLNEKTVLSIKNISHSVTAMVEVPADGGNGVIIAQGGSIGGWSLYVKNGFLTYCYNYFGLDFTIVTATVPLLPGRRQVQIAFAYDGGGLGLGGQITLAVDGDVVGSGRLERSVPYVFSGDETCDVGREFGSPVSPDYGPRDNAFTGEVDWVQIDLEGESHDHLVSPDAQFQIAMARQ